MTTSVEIADRARQSVASALVAAYGVETLPEIEAYKVHAWENPYTWLEHATRLWEAAPNRTDAPPPELADLVAARAKARVEQQAWAAERQAWRAAMAARVDPDYRGEWSGLRNRPAPEPAPATETTLTRPMLRQRGWTDSLIRDLLGAPDAMRGRVWLYREDRVSAAETHRRYRAHRDRTVDRSEYRARLAALQLDPAAYAAALDIVVPVLPRSDLERLAIESHERLHAKCDARYRDDAVGQCRWEPPDPADTNRKIVNYLRHERTDYETELAHIRTYSGIDQFLYRVVLHRVYAEIAKTYPDLFDECERQFIGRLEGGRPQYAAHCLAHPAPTS